MANLKKYASILFHSLSAESAPSILKGALAELLGKVSVTELCKWIEEDVTLWDKVPAKFQNIARDFSDSLGNLDWLTASWLMQAVKKDHPALVSLFLSWPKARKWLEKQIQIIKKEIVVEEVKVE